MNKSKLIFEWVSEISNNEPRTVHCWLGPVCVGKVIEQDNGKFCAVFGSSSGRAVNFTHVDGVDSIEEAKSYVETKATTWLEEFTREPTVREAFELAYGPFYKDASCYVAYSAQDSGGLRPMILCNGVLFEGIEGTGWQPAWRGNDEEGPDVSDRSAKAFKGFFFDKAYNEAVDKLTNNNE